MEERKGSSEDADHAEVDGDETTTPVGKGSDGGTSSSMREGVAMVAVDGIDSEECCTAVASWELL